MFKPNSVVEKLKFLDLTVELQTFEVLYYALLQMHFLGLVYSNVEDTLPEVDEGEGLSEGGVGELSGEGVPEAGDRVKVDALGLH